MGTNHSGWCLTNHHGTCPHEFTSHTCGCPCHGGEVPESTPTIPTPKKPRGKK